MLPIRGLKKYKEGATATVSAVTAVPSGPAMTATFTPNFGMTLAEAAAICKVDHFNWVQWSTFDNVPATVDGVEVQAPYLDPPLGGWDYQKTQEWVDYFGYLGDDFLDGYFNEPSGELDRFTNTNTHTLDYVDIPGGLGEAGSLTSFKTALAGVDDNGNTTAIGDWFFGDATSAGVSLRKKNFDESIITTPGILLHGVFSIESLPTEDIEFLNSQGIAVSPHGDHNGDYSVTLADLEIVRNGMGALVQRSSWSSFSVNSAWTSGVNIPHCGRRPMTTSCDSTQKDDFDAISAHRRAQGGREEPCYATRRSLTTGR